MFRPLNRKSLTSVGPFWPAMNVSVKYCGIEKTGSTSVTRILRSMSEKAKMLQKMVSLTKKKIRISKLINNVSKNISFLFVRDPYARLLSAYFDKLFIPNTFFWKTTGRYIVSNFRPNASKHSLRCGHDVTFPEFIKYVIHSQETGKHRDGHFVPIHDHCNICHRHYDFIGHLESFTEDVNYILDDIHSPYKYNVDFSAKTISESSKRTLVSMRNEVKQCMTIYEATQRLWNRYLERGIISKHELFPIKPGEASYITADNFSELAIQALNRSRLHMEKKIQQNEALAEGFAYVPLLDKLKLKETLFLDFLLFGFNPKTESVFDTFVFSKSKNFSYFGNFSKQ